jgi:hypothetical protein
LPRVPQVMPGLTKLTWTGDRSMLDTFCREARRHCRTAASSVAAFKEGCARLDATFRQGPAASKRPVLIVAALGLRRWRLQWALRWLWLQWARGGCALGLDCC